jgi:3-oxoacyl-[acyl-carrier-protein] synthase II
VHFNGDEHFAAPKLRMLDRVSQFAIVAARQAIGDARLDIPNADRQRVGIFLGTGMGGSQTTDDGYQTLYAKQSNRIKPFTVLMGMANAPAAWIGIEYGVTGPNLTYSTACSSSAVSIGEAWMRIRTGDLDVAIAGGAEAPLSFGGLKAWEVLHTLATEDPSDASTSCKPFSKNRSGMVLGEGAAIVVLEDWERAIQRGAIIHGELIGYGIVTDASHIARPTVAGQAAAMRAALQVAACAPASIDNINAHGTGTQANDSVETAAIKQVFGEDAFRIPISATKAIHGHLLGASGALEFALSLLAMQHDVLLPTMHLDIAAADCDLDYVSNCARHNVKINTVMSNSFAFGGTNAVLVARSAAQRAGTA